MAISSSELKFYRSYGIPGSVLQPDSDGSTSPLTGNAGGGITSTQLTGTLNQVLRAVKGSDTQSADFYDYNKIYFRNTNGVLGLQKPGLYISSKSAYAQDQIAISIGLTDSAYTLDGGAGVSEFAEGREDYDEETDGATAINSPYPRVTGAGNESTSLRTTFSLDTSYFVGADENLRIGSLPDDVDNNVYVKAVGVDSNNTIAVGYALLTGKVATNTIEFKVNRDDSGASVDFARVYYLSCHTDDYDDTVYGGISGPGTSVSATGMDGPEGDLEDIYLGTAASIPVQYYNGASWDTIGYIKSGDDGTHVGQVFVPAFYIETSIDAVSEAFVLPELVISNPANGFDQNDYGEQDREYIAIWVRRKVDQSASAAASVPNTITCYGDSA